MPEKILTVEDLEIKFELRGKTLHAIRGISMELHRGEILAIVGESGSGKSVFTKSFMGLLDQNGHVTAGKVTYYGADNREPVELTSLKKEKEWLKIRGREIAMIMQDPMTSLSPLKTIGVQIMEAVLLHQNVNRAEAQILDLIKELRHKYHLSVILITHDLGVVANIADRVAVMYAGDIIEIGTGEDIFYDARHPYTWALLSSLPQVGVKGTDLFSIPGTPPNLFTEIKGDAFAPRNPKALKIDFIKQPPYFDVSPTHKAKTWLLDQRAPKVEPPSVVEKIRNGGLFS